MDFIVWQQYQTMQDPLCMAVMQHCTCAPVQHLQLLLQLWVAVLRWSHQLNIVWREILQSVETAYTKSSLHPLSASLSYVAARDIMIAEGHVER